MGKPYGYGGVGLKDLIRVRDLFRQGPWYYLVDRVDLAGSIISLIVRPSISTEEEPDLEEERRIFIHPETLLRNYTRVLQRPAVVSILEGYDQ